MALTQKELNLLDELSRLNQRLETKLMALERTATPKPLRGTRKREKARAKRQEAKHALSVRAQCVVRDGYCLLLSSSHGPCAGPSEWAHIGTHRRCHTRGMAPEQRHTTKGSAMLCKRHHDAYDAHEFDIQPRTAAGMDGAFAVIRRAA